MLVVRFLEGAMFEPVSVWRNDGGNIDVAWKEI